MKPKFMKMITLFCGILVLILDAKTAFAGASEGLQLCIRIVIPSLFPFLMLSMLLTSSLTDSKLSFFQPLCRLLRISHTAGSILLVGYLGGYPVGAQCLATARKKQQISKEAADRLVAFCSNAGPSFLFGLGMLLFDSIGLCFLAWAIQILSSVVVALLTPGHDFGNQNQLSSSPMTLTAALQQALETLALVCGWVILFRVLLAFLSRWFLWLLPEIAEIIVYGLMELSNGCCALEQIEPVGLRFLLFTSFLSFGGFCVCLQTLSVLSGSGIHAGYYLWGKLTQAAVSILIAAACQLGFSEAHRVILPLPVWMLCAISMFCYWIFSRNAAKSSSIPQPTGV